MEQCAKSVKYPNLTFVTYWTGTWLVKSNKTAKAANTSDTGANKPVKHLKRDLLLRPGQSS